VQSAASRPEPPAGTSPVRPAGTESLALPPAQDAGLLLIALAGVSASGPIMAATAAPALAIAFWRNALGSVSTMLLTGPRLRATLLAPDRRGWAVSALAGVFLALHFGTWVPSVKLTSVASATGLVATQSIFAGLVAAAAGRRLPRLAWLGMLLAFVGTLFIAGADVQISARAVAGDGLAVLGGLFAALYVTAGGHARQRMSAASYTIICYATCSAGLLVACLVGGQPLTGYPVKAWLLIGAVTNRWTMELQQSWRFRFQWTPDMKTVIADTQKAGQQWAIPAKEDGSSPEDYIMLCRITSSFTGGPVIVAAGLKQFGTEAAGRLLTDSDQLGTILRNLPRGWEQSNVQFVLHARVIGNTPAQPELVASYVW